MLIMPGDSLTDSNTFTYLMHVIWREFTSKKSWVLVQYMPTLFKEFLINNKITEYATNVDFF